MKVKYSATAKIPRYSQHSAQHITFGSDMNFPMQLHLLIAPGRYLFGVLVPATLRGRSPPVVPVELGFNYFSVCKLI